MLCIGCLQIKHLPAFQLLPVYFIFYYLAMIAKNIDLHWEQWLEKWFYPLILLGICINASGLFVTVMEPDAALYASISKTMVQSGDFINLFVEGKDWLDKPHFPFWMIALSYKVWGINNFAYKLPALLFWGMGLWYTYRFTLALYNRSIGRLAALIYVTAAHLVISNSDVKAEPYLTGLIIGSIYHFYRASEKKISWHLVTGSLLAACAIMTKGPFVLITIGAGFIVEWIILRKWTEFVNPRWWLAILLVLIFILPELYCLYVQFDLQPQKIVFNKTGVSGIRFFFWDSQFGRFFNTGPIKGKGDLFFYFHTILWAFIPWSLLLVAATGWKLSNLNKNYGNPEFITIGYLTLTFIIFSISRFQLPHYLNILFPFLAIISAQYLYSINKSRNIKIAKWVQNCVTFLLIVLVLAITVFFKLPRLYFPLLWILLFIILAFSLFTTNNLTNLFGRSFFVAILIYGFLNLFFYPALLKYQPGSEAAFYINSLPSKQKAVCYPVNYYSFIFYLNTPIQYLDINEIKKQKEPMYIFTKQENLDSLVSHGLKVDILKHFAGFHTSQLSGKFINYTTRQEVVKDYIVGRITP